MMEMVLDVDDIVSENDQVSVNSLLCLQSTNGLT